MKALTFIFLLSNIIILAQPSTIFIDSRDNRTYQTVVIGTDTWFQEYLRFQTEDCFCKGKKAKEKNCQITNYYSNKKLSEVCPVNWHIASLSDWQKAIAVIMEEQQIDAQTIQIDTIENGTVINIFDRLALMGNNTTQLNLQSIGWVQGNSIREKQSTTLWIYDEKSQNNRFHIHYGDKGYTQHAHVHNIDAPFRKRRRFAVRCVKDK